jgi:hypothetical protein
MADFTPSELAALPQFFLELLIPAVQLDLKEVSGFSEERLRREAIDAGVMVATSGDVLLFGYPKKATRKARADFMVAWKAMVRGLAIGALMPGGVQMFGIHWIVDDRRAEVPS